MQNTIDFSGIWIPSITPFDKEDVYKIDYKKFANLLDYLINEQKANGIVPFGTTGEYSTLSHEEEKEGLRFTIDYIQGRVPVMAATGSNDTRTTINITQEAEKLGANAALVVVPYYNKPDQRGIYNHFATIAKSTSLPIFIYNIPARTAVNAEPETIIQLAQDFPNIYGVKDVACDVNQTEKLINAKADIHHPFYVLSGDDCNVCTCLKLGGDGAISASANILGAEMQEMYHVCKNRNDEKYKTINLRIEKIFDLLFKEPNPAPIKACFDIMQMEFGGELRLPLMQATEELKNELKIELKKLQKI